MIGGWNSYWTRRNSIGEAVSVSERSNENCDRSEEGEQGCESCARAAAMLSSDPTIDRTEMIRLACGGLPPQEVVS